MVEMAKCLSALEMGRLIAVHSIRGFKAHGSVHRRQFAYRDFLYFDKWHIVITSSVFRSVHVNDVTYINSR